MWLSSVFGRLQTRSLVPLSNAAWWVGLNQEEAQAWLETRPLHKPSVRYRKTINVWSREKMGYTGVMAQHYAVLVTDVDQWLYPELQE